MCMHPNPFVDPRRSASAPATRSVVNYSNIPVTQFYSRIPIAVGSNLSSGQFPVNSRVVFPGSSPVINSDSTVAASSSSVISPSMSSDISFGGNFKAPGPRYFSGNPNERVEDFLMGYNFYAKVNKWVGETKCEGVRVFLERKADERRSDSRVEDESVSLLRCKTIRLSRYGTTVVACDRRWSYGQA